MITETLTRTALTEYETEKLHMAFTRVKDYSFEVGVFMTRWGQPDLLQKASDLFLSLNAELFADVDIRTGALEYGLAFAENRANDRHASQAANLVGGFLALVYSATIADRLTSKAGV